MIKHSLAGSVPETAFIKISVIKIECKGDVGKETSPIGLALTFFSSDGSRALMECHYLWYSLLSCLHGRPNAIASISVTSQAI